MEAVKRLTAHEAMEKFKYQFEPFVYIHNRKNFLLGQIPELHPDGTEYLVYWKEVVRECIEGRWATDGPGYRWMPGNLFFYVNLGTILHKPEDAPKTAPRQKIRPYLRDVEWEFFYNWIECRGFSGFEDDEEYTCNKDVLKYEQGKLTDFDFNRLNLYAFKRNGELKKYIPAREYLRKLHDKPLGLALFDNEAQNMFMLGARGFGKSYMVSVGIVLYEWLFDGRKYYNRMPELYGGDTTKNKVEIFVGAAQASKSADLLSKFKDAYDELPGGWGQGDEYVPPPYFKSATGSLTPAAPKPWKHEYLVKEAGNWVPKGSGSTIKHGVYTTENPEAAAGTRPAVMVIEEVGLLPNALTVHNSNEACVLVSGTRIGSCMYLGTGGNMEKIRESEIMFRDPGTYSFLSFDDVYEGKGQIGWFVPAFYNVDKFKDENGNTMYEHAIPYYLDRRKEKRKGKSGQHAIDLELMNFPMVPSEMFLRKHGNILPIDELRRRLAQLEKNDLFEQIEKPVSLYFDSSKKYGVGYDIITDHSKKPINKFPTPTNTDPEGCPVIYEFPLEKDGEVPKDMYIIGHDPYASDDSENGSYASIYVFKTGKYQLDGLGHNEIVAEYVGRPYAGRNKVNDILEKFAMLYNVGPGGIWFENDRGNTKEYFEKRNKLGLLCLKPMTVLSKTLTRRMSGGSVQYGYSMGSKQAKLQGIEYLRDWLLEQRGEHNGVKLRNLDLLASRAFIQECISFNMDDNFDRVMGACGFVIGLRNIENELIDEAIEKKSSAGSFFGSNKGLFMEKRRRNNRQDRYR